MILSRYVNESDIVQANGPLAELVSTEQFWVELLVPIEKLRWFTPNKDSLNATVVIARDKNVMHGDILKIVRNLDDLTKMGKVIVTIDDPLQLKKLKAWKSNNITGPSPSSLMLGDHVEVNLKGHRMHNVVRIEHSSLRDGNHVWVLSNNNLVIKAVSIVYSDNDYYYVGQGLKEGDLLITSNINVPKAGMVLHRYN